MDVVGVNTSYVLDSTRRVLNCSTQACESRVSLPTRVPNRSDESRRSQNDGRIGSANRTWTGGAIGLNFTFGVTQSVHRSVWIEFA